MAAARRFIRWWWLGCALMALPLLAQDHPEAPTGEDRSTAPGTARIDRAPPIPERPAPTASATTREFKPSEEVSPDQEVDFPADL